MPHVLFLAVMDKSFHKAGVDPGGPWIQEPSTPPLFGRLTSFIKRDKNVTHISPGAKLENGGLPYTESPLSFDGFN